jgi:hypothetical protein
MRHPAHQVLGHPEAGWYFRSLGALQLSTTEIEVGERQQREYLRTVFGDAAIANLTITELAFEDAEDMLNLGADSAMAPVALPLRRRQLPAWFALHFDGPVNTCGAVGAFLFLVDLALVGEHRPVIIADEIVHHLGVVDFAGRHAGGMDKAASASTPMRRSTSHP